MTTTNVITEAPLYVEYSVKSDVFQDFGVNTARERRPQPPTSVWFEMADIPATPPTVADGLTGGVTKVADLALTQVSGNTNRYENAAFINMVPSTASSTDDTAYRPTLKDSTGATIPWNVTVWVADSYLNVVEFKSGVPSGFTAPFTLTFWRYDGVQQATNGTFQVTSGVNAPTGLGTSATYADDFVVGSNQLDRDSADANKNARMYFDKGLGAFRAGISTSDEWDVAKRGQYSAAFGSDTEAQGNYSFSAGDRNDSNGNWSAVVGGQENTVTTSDRSVVLGGQENTVSLSGGMSVVAGGYQNAISSTQSHNGITSGLSNTIDGDARNCSTVGGQLLTITGGDQSIIAGGDANTIVSTGAANVIAGGDTNAITADSSNNAIVGGLNNTISSTRGVGNCAIVAGEGNTINAGAIVTNSAIVAGLDCTLGTLAGEHNAIIAAHLCTISAGDDNLITGHSNTVTAGSQSFVGGVAASIGHSRCFVWNGGNALGATTLATTTNDSFLVRAVGGVTFYTDTGGSAGSYMAAGDNGWTDVSLRTSKDLQEETSGTDVLDLVMQTPIYRYNYKGQDPEKRYVGPCADDWHASFPSSKDQNGIMARDLAGVSLGAIQGLGRLMAGVQKENATLREEMDELRAQMAALV
jgi:hypothetical protein